MEQSIKRKIEAVGKPLKEWDVKINRGILTGYNEAFIIDGDKKEELISQDPKSAEIIRPILRGRDIKRYGYDFADKWVIATFPSRHYDIEQYPAVKKHLLSFGIERLEQTGKTYNINGKEVKARKKTNNRWFETQDNISYWEDFNKQKIMWGEISDISKFSLINREYYPEATTFFMIGKHLSYLLGVLNSKLGEWLFNQIGTTTGVGTNRWKKYKLEEFYVKIPTKNDLLTISSSVNHILEFGTSQNKLEIINKYIYAMYDLSNNESNFINSYQK